MFQKTEKKLSHVDLGKTAKQGITEYSFFGLLDHLNSNFPGFVSLFSIHFSSFIMHSGTSLLYYCVFTELCKRKILHICCSSTSCTPGLFFYLLHNFLSKHNIFQSGIIFKQLRKYRPPPLSPIPSPHPSQKN